LTAPIPLLKFPRTPHLLELGSKGEDDFAIDIFNHSNGKLEGKLTIEEKIDGANMGISLGWDMGLVVQNRSHWIQSDSHAQFKSLDLWLDKFRITLTNLLLRDELFPERYILYGEWVAARHSIGYTALPDRFIAFDLYDRLSGAFWSRGYLDRVLEGTGIAQVPCLGQRDDVSKEEILDMIQRPSAFISGHGNGHEHGHGDRNNKGQGEGYEEQRRGERMEGVYIRFEDPERKITTARGKVVRGDFIAGNEHWSKGKIVWNGLKREEEVGEY
jgi:atypical dual specificity phosphatase